MQSIKETIREFDTKYNLDIGKSLGFVDDTSSPDSPTHSIFKLPITYLSPDDIRPLSPTVSSDLELVAATTETKGMYDYLLKPQHDFAVNIIPEWNRQFTTNTEFLSESQEIIHHFPQYLEGMQPKDITATTQGEPYCFTQDKCQNLMGIWKDTKEDPNFLEKYCYIEWDMVKYLNKSSHFLQSLSVINMMAPVMSFIIPIIFFIFPFIILKIQNVPITFQMYIQVLKDIARHHFIGKTIANLQSLSWDKLIYMLITVGLYFLQIYQNINLCTRFYKNIHKINSHLTELRDYLGYSIQSMENFVTISKELPTYTPFVETTKQHCNVLRGFYDELLPIHDFQPGFSKITEIGYLLKMFYELHSNSEIETSLRYSMGFEGYINNLLGIHENLTQRNVAVARFPTVEDNTNEVDISANMMCKGGKTTNFRKQYYPPLMGKEHVKNSFDLSNNAIITGPNASGKTTMLKTTTINVIFSQQFGVGFYQSASITPYTHVHSYLNIPDTSGRDSLFQAESRRCKEIIDIIQKPYEKNTSQKARHFAIFDELYSGTNPTEATQSAYAFLLYLSKFQNVDYILTTHYVSLCKKLEKQLVKKENLAPVMNYKMDVVIHPESGKVKYTYVMKRGISKIQGAVLILEEMKYPKEILDEMRKIKME